TVYHVIHKNVDFILVAGLTAGAFFGTMAGARIQKKISGAAIRKYFAFIVLAAILMVCFKIYRLVYAGDNSPKPGAKPAACIGVRAPNDSLSQVTPEDGDRPSDA
ncbi:MAG: sulfite exporter TauE/SafE family protein, partial [Lentisphaerae bacterium]